MIVEKIDEMVQRKIEQWPVHSNRASSVGFPCERKLVYDRTRWQDKLLHDIGLQYIFSEGNRQEKVVIDDLREAGFEIIEAQRPFEDKKLQLTGHIDFKLQINDKLYPVEVKGLSPYTWKDLNSFEDILKNKRVYVRGYASQMTLYLYLTESEEGLFLLRNKLTGRYKEIFVKLDWDIADKLIKKLQSINKHIKENTLPDFCDDPEHCLRCQFRHICLPDMKASPGVKFIDKPELEAKLKRLDEIKESVKEFNQLDKEVKEEIKEQENLCVGDYLISGKWIVVNKKEQPAKEASSFKYWKSKIINLIKK